MLASPLTDQNNMACNGGIDSGRGTSVRLDFRSDEFFIEGQDGRPINVTEPTTLADKSGRLVVTRRLSTSVTDCDLTNTTRIAGVTRSIGCHKAIDMSSTSTGCLTTSDDFRSSLSQR